jgi:hypothetical protein
VDNLRKGLCDSLSGDKSSKPTGGHDLVEKQILDRNWGQGRRAAHPELTLGPAKSLPCRNPGQGKDDARIRHHGVGPALLSGFPKRLEFLFRHLHIYLDGAFHAPLYRGFVVAGQRYSQNSPYSPAEGSPQSQTLGSASTGPTLYLKLDF